MEIFIADSVGPLQKYEKRNHYRSIEDFFRYSSVDETKTCYADQTILIWNIYSGKI